MHALTSSFSAVFSSSWVQLSLDVAVKATVLLVLAAIAAFALRRSSAAVRHRVWCLTFAGLLLLPALSAGLPEWRLEVLPQGSALAYSSPLAPREENSDQAWRSEPTRPFAQRQVPGDLAARERLFADRPPLVTPGGPLAEREDYYTPALDAEAQDTPVADEPRRLFGPLALAFLWLLGVVAAVSPLGAGLLRNYLLRRHAQPVAEAAWIGLLDELRSRLGLRRRVVLYETRAALMPMTWGMLAPIVMLPHAAREWTDRLRRFVLLHELAHVKRCDVVFQMLARLACALYWFHPLAWYALRRLRIERELACDDCVVQAGERPSDYAAELLEIARSYRPLRLAAAVPMAQTSNLERRIRALFDRACSHLPVSRSTARLLLVGMAITVTTVAVIRLAPRAVAEAEEPSTAASSTETSDAAQPPSDVAQPPSAGSRSPSATDRQPGSQTAASVQPASTIHGQVIDLEGRPIVGAKVQVVSISTAAEDGGKLDAWLAAVQIAHDASEMRAADQEYLRKLTLDNSAVSRATPTDQDGRFEIDAGGEECVVELRIDGERIESTLLRAVTRPIEPLQVPAHLRDVAAGIINPGDEVLVRGSSFQHVAAPGCHVVGVVRDEQTDRAVAGATVLAGRWSGLSESLFRTTTDADGHFLLSGISARAKPTQVVVVGPPDEPYIAKTLDASLERPGDRATIDFGLERGVWIEGQVTDKATGRGVEATVTYHAWNDNPYLTRTGAWRLPRWENVRRNTDRDGRFRLLGLPGRGLVSAAAGGEYAFGVGAERLGTGDSLRARTQPNFRLEGSNTVVEIDVEAHAETVRCDIELESGRQRQGVVLGPDGKALDGVHFAAGWRERWIGDRPLEASRFTVEQLVPGRSRMLVFVHEARKLIGTIEVSGDGEEPVEVRMEPWAGVRGRAVDGDGKPHANLVVVTSGFRRRTKAGKDGQFEIDRLAPGAKYTFGAQFGEAVTGWLARDVVLNAGEIRDLGDVVVEPPKTSASAEKSAPAAADAPAPKNQPPGGNREAAGNQPALVLRGHVLDSSGKPQPGARVRVIHVDLESGTWVKNGRLLAETKSTSDGSFAVEVRDAAPFASLDRFVQSSTVVLADTPGKGIDWSHQDWSHQQPAGKPLNLQLVDDAAIEGRILDLEGRPIAGIRVTVDEVSGGATDLGSWIEKAKNNPVSLDPDQMMRPIKDRKKNPGPSIARYPGNKNLQLGTPELMPSAETGRDGRFRLLGLGRDRQVRLQLEGAGIAKTWLTVVTHDMPPVPYPGYDPRFRVQTCFGRRFDLTAEPEQHITGVIRDADTGEPLPGVEVRLTRYADSLLFVEGFLAATTDDQGRYVLRGVPKPNHPERTHCLRLMPAAGQPYFRTEANPPKKEGLGPVSFDVALKRAIRVHGQVRDATTGDPVRGLVAYYPFLSNKTASDFPNFNSGLLSVGNDDWYATDQDGRYEIPVLPGRGIVMFAAWQGDRYAEADGAEAIADLYQADGRRLNIYHLLGLEVASAVREIDAAHAETMFDIKLRRLDATEIEFVDPAGSPLVGVVTRRLVPVRLAAVGDRTSEWSRDALSTAVAELIGGQDQSRTAMFAHRQKKLAAVLRLSRTTVPPNRVVLRPCAAMVGRVIDHRGMPVSDFEVSVNAASEPGAELEEGWKYATLDRRHQLAILVSDRDGIFRLESVPPGVAYVLSAANHRSKLQKTTPVIQPGERLDLGDVVLEAPEATDEKTSVEAKQETSSRTEE